jgi:hypothetical protein
VRRAVMISSPSHPGDVTPKGYPSIGAPGASYAVDVIHRRGIHRRGKSGASGRLRRSDRAAFLRTTKTNPKDQPSARLTVVNT